MLVNQQGVWGGMEVWLVERDGWGGGGLVCQEEARAREEGCLWGDAGNAGRYMVSVLGGWPMANDGWAGWRLYPRAMPGAGIGGWPMANAGWAGWRLVPWAMP